MPEQHSQLTPEEYLAELKAKSQSKHRSEEADGPEEEGESPNSQAEQTAGEAVSASESASQADQDSGESSPSSSDEEMDSSHSAAETRSETESRLSELFQRVNLLLGDTGEDSNQPFRPHAPESLAETGLTAEEVERLILKFLLARGSATGREICSQVKLPFSIIDPLLKQLKHDQLVTFKGTAAVGDYEFLITDAGRDRARRYSEECTYFGTAPVTLRDYLGAMEAQSIARQEATEEDLHQAFSDLIINRTMFSRLGPAINSGRGMFLFGEPGNGKTSIAERVTSCFGSTIWIPRALSIEGDIIRIYDPGVHEIVEEEEQQSGDKLFDLSSVDHRWVQVVRPTVIAGGELTMSELEVVQNSQTKICEAPLQLKSNCGTLVIDDFGRQTMPVDVLLNRWIVPLEKRFDFLNMPSGKKVQVPFDQLIIFSTNLEPKDLVDEAFLRRIPYKIEVPDPSREEFHSLFDLMAPMMGFEYDDEVIEYLIETHYVQAGRPLRSCHPRDLLLQVKNYCTYHNLPKRLTREAFDFAIDNYFSVL